MKSSAMDGFKLCLLDKSHDRASFNCGMESLDNYLKQRAGQDRKKHMAVTYVLSYKKSHEVAGYFTLSSSAIELNGLPQALQKKLPNYPFLPATLIGRLAVDKKYQGKGFGEILLLDALKRAHLSSVEVASYAVVVDAINEAAEQFYKKYGFIDLSSHSRKLFLTMKSISELFKVPNKKTR